MGEGESMYLIYSDYFAKLTKFPNDIGVVSYAKAVDGKFVKFEYAVYGSYIRILAVTSETVSSEAIDSLNMDLGGWFEIDLSTDLDANVRLSSAVEGFLEI